MDTTVVKEILPLSLEDKKILRKNTLISLVAISFFETIAYLIMFKFVNTSDFETGRMIFFGFFLLVGGIIIFINVSSYFDPNKIVSVGFVTNKRSVSRRGGKNSSSSIDYYITLGNDEISVMGNYYSQVAKGDKIKMEQTKWNKSIFKIEVLEKAASMNQQYTSVEINQLELKTVVDYLDQLEKSIIKSKLLKILFWRSLVWGGIAYVLYYIFFLALLLALPKELSLGFRWLPLFLPLAVSLGIYILVNRKTFRVFKDFSEGKKKISSKIISDVIQNNKPMVGKNIVITSGRSGEYFYIITHDNSFYEVSSEMGKYVKAGDIVRVHESYNCKIQLKVSVE